MPIMSHNIAYENKSTGILSFYLVRGVDAGSLVRVRSNRFPVPLVGAFVTV